MSDLPRDQKVRLLEAIQERQRRQKVAPLFYYQPHAGQQRTHTALVQHRVVIVTCGNRWGKSHLNAAECIAHLYGYRPWLLPEEYRRLTPEGDYPRRADIPPEYWIRRADGVPLLLPAHGLMVTGLGLVQGILRTMWPKLETFLPTAVREHPDYTVRRGAFGCPVEVRLPKALSTGGASLSFGSGEQSPMMFEGQNYSFVGIDEPPKRAIFGAIWRGMTDLYAPMWMTMTPIGPNAPWVHEEFEEKIATGDRTDAIVISGSIWENHHIAETAKTEFLEGGGFNEDEKAARETGSWTFLSHRAFPQYDPAVHLVPSTHPVPPGWIRGLAVDPAHRRPFMMIWAAFGPNGEMLVYREWPHEDHAQLRSSTLTVPDYVRIIHEQECGEPIHFRCLDPRFGAAAPAAKGLRLTSIQEDFAQEGLYFDCSLEGTEREEIGIERLRQMLRWDKSAPLSPLNVPLLRLRDDCINAQNALRLSNFKTPSLLDPDNLEEKMLARFKDARDCLRYLALYPKMGLNLLNEEWSYIPSSELEQENAYVDPDWF